MPCSAPRKKNRRADRNVPRTGHRRRTTSWSTICFSRSPADVAPSSTSTGGLSFFVNGTAPTEIYTLSLHDALPISPYLGVSFPGAQIEQTLAERGVSWRKPDRKSTRLNSSHSSISYAVFCLKK